MSSFVRKKMTGITVLAAVDSMHGLTEKKAAANYSV